MSREQIIKEIASERERQIVGEHWSEDHDDAHKCGELAMAAAMYASPRKDLVVIESQGPHGQVLADPWPWHSRYAMTGVRGRDWYKPKTRRRDLVRAAALIVAEIERLEREEDRSAPQCVEG